jgi:TolB-like protein
MSQDEDGTLDALNAIRAELAEPGATARGGRVVKTMGDGILLEFSSAADAVAFSIEFQREVEKRRRADAAPIQFRIGVNVGDVISQDGDIFGDGVNIAARLESIADPGGICISDETLRLVSGKMKISAEDLGERALKNIETPVRAHRILSGVSASPASSYAAPDGDALPRRSERPSLAIMPFIHLGSDPKGTFVTDGIALGLQTLLVQLSNLFFVNACMHTGYREGRQTAAEALADMPVRYALEGAVQQSGARVRVQARLSDLATGAMIWAESYDRDLDDIFELQDEITRRIVSALSIQLVGGPVAPQFTDSLRGPDAWEHFLRGINLFYNRNKPNCTEALKHFRTLSEACPKSAVGPNYIATLLYILAIEGWSKTPAETVAEATRWAERALALEEGHNGLSHAVLGGIALSERRHDESLRLCREGVAFRANCPFALERYGMARTFSGDPEGGIKYIREAISVRLVRVPSVVNLLALSYRDQGNIGLSIPAARESDRLSPGNIDALATLCSDFALNGDAVEARATATRLISAAPEFSARAYAEAQPYRNLKRAEQLCRALIEAGVPA